MGNEVRGGARWGHRTHRGFSRAMARLAAPCARSHPTGAAQAVPVRSGVRDPRSRGGRGGRCPLWPTTGLLGAAQVGPARTGPAPSGGETRTMTIRAQAWTGTRGPENAASEVLDVLAAVPRRIMNLESFFLSIWGDVTQVPLCDAVLRFSRPALCRVLRPKPALGHTRLPAATPPSSESYSSPRHSGSATGSEPGSVPSLPGGPCARSDPRRHPPPWSPSAACGTITLPG